MAIVGLGSGDAPDAPTATTTVAYAMREAGIFNVSNSQIGQMIADGFQVVKSEIWSACAKDDLLATETLVIVTTGQSVVTLPVEFEEEKEVRFFWSSDDARGLVTASQSGAVTLWAEASASDNAYTGLYFFTLTGDGEGQYRQTTGYVGSEQVASLTAALSTPTSTSTQGMIGERSYCLDRDDLCTRMGATGLNTILGNTTVHTLPTRYEILGTTMRIWPPPGRAYPVIIKAYLNLTRIPQTSAMFIEHLRERWYLWVQGIKVRTMAEFDDDRYQTEKTIWDQMLARHAGTNLQTTRVAFRR